MHFNKFSLLTKNKEKNCKYFFKVKLYKIAYNFKKFLDTLFMYNQNSKLDNFV